MNLQVSTDTAAVREIPRPLETYPSAADQSLAAELSARVQLEPFNGIATGVFVLAILHTFAAARLRRSRIGYSIDTTYGGRRKDGGHHL